MDKTKWSFAKTKGFEMGLIKVIEEYKKENCGAYPSNSYWGKKFEDAYNADVREKIVTESNKELLIRYTKWIVEVESIDENNIEEQVSQFLLSNLSA